jgi:hypothetical protein
MVAVDCENPNFKILKYINCLFLYGDSNSKYKINFFQQLIDTVGYIQIIAVRS